MLEKYEQLKKNLKAHIFGQNEAIEQLVQALIHAELSPVSQRFKALFTFIGPHNSGKLYTATLLQKYLDEYEAIKIFDMAQYTEPTDEKKLIGLHGELTLFVHKYPKSIVVFKDIEKCDNSIQLALLGQLQSSTEKGVDFGQTLIIFTTTLGSSLIKKEDFLKFYKKDPLKAQAKLVEFIAKEKKIIYDVMESAIDPELLSLMVQNYIILFHPLRFKSLVKIADKILKDTIHTLRTRLDLHIKIADKRVVELLTLSFTPYLNARRIHKKLPDMLIDLIQPALSKGKKILIQSDPALQDLLDRIDDNFLQSMVRKNETLQLKWKIEENEAIHLVCTQAIITKLPYFVEPTEKPYIGYSSISFGDIAGQKQVKESLKEIVRIIKNPKTVKRFDISMPKGLLLHGPKGVGKTLLAYAFAKEAQMPFVLLAGSDLYDVNLIQNAYQKAKELAPAIVFLDELDGKEDIPIPYDAIAAQIDAVSDEEYVFTIATATHLDPIDKNLLASERIDILIEVPELDMEARKYFVKKILKKPNDGKIDVDRVARYMSGLSGYEMQRVAKEAALYVIRKNLSYITEEILIEQINNIKYGQKIDKKRIRNPEKDLRKTAYHEAGHAVLSYLLLPDIKIEQVTITPRAEALGFVSYSDEFIANISKEELFNDICVALAGRIAKLKKFPEEGEDTGAAQDLEQATWAAYNLIAAFGMDEEIGYIHIDTLVQNVDRDLYKSQIEERIAYWIKKARQKSEEMVVAHWEKIEKVAQALIQKEMIDAEELKRIMES